MPLPAEPPAAIEPGADRWNRLAWALVGLGIAARLVRYLLAFPLWGDECMLAENFLGRGFADLLRPLDNCQVAPPLFLMLELAAVKLLGFSEWSLRLPALASGIAGLLVFRHLAGRLLRGPGYVLAIGFMAAAFYPIRHSAEVKPYALDLLVAVTLSAMAVEWWRDRAKTRWLWALTLTVPLAVGLSFPTVFVAGGISLLVLCELLRSGNRAAIWPAAAFHAVLAASVVGLLALSAANQLDQWGPMMRKCWVAAFPPTPVGPWPLIKWLAETYSGPMFAYPLGGKPGTCCVTLACFLVGFWGLVRRGDRLLALMLAAPFVLGLVSGVLRLYPYGDNERLVQYLGPAICLLAGLGAAQLAALVRPAAPRRAAVALAVLLGAIAGGQTVRDLTHPYKHRCDWDHQGFARWFWNQDADTAELVAMPRHLNAQIYNRTDYCSYVCYQAIYGRRAKKRSAGQSPAQPPKALDYVVFHSDESEPNRPALDAWLRQLEPRYCLAGCTRYRVKTDVGPPHDFFGWYDVYRFCPKEEPPLPKVVQQPQPGEMLR
jgi:hypothetical protein